MIGERHQAAGDWSLRLVDATPHSIRDDLDAFGLVIVTEAWLPLSSVSEATLLASAMYSGVLLEAGNGRRELAGHGMAMLLGVEDGLSDLYETAPSFTTASRTIASHVQNGVLRTAGPTMNGVSQGALSASATARTLEIDAGTSPLDYLNAACEVFSMEWRINPDGSLDVDTAANLYSAVSVLFTPNAGGHETGTGSLLGFAGPVRLTRDWSEYTTKVVVVDTAAGSGSSTTGAVPFYGLDGVTLTRDRLVDSATTTTGNAATLAAALRGKFDDSRGRVHAEVSAIDTYAPRRWIGVGDTVYLYDLDAGVYDTATQVAYRGEMAFPLSARVRAIDWPVEQGMGVYFRRSNAASPDLIDLTPYVEWEPRGARVQVGNTRRAPRGRRPAVAKL